MTDERFDRDLRASIERAMDVKAPSSLRADVDLVLSGETAVRRQRRTPGWLRFGLAAAAILAVVAVVGVGMSRMPSGIAASTAPSAAPSASPAPTDAAGSPVATFPADWASRIGMPVVVVPAGLARSTTLPQPPFSVARAGQPPTGPFAYRASSTTGAASDVVSVIDLGGGSIRPITLPLRKGEQLDRLQAADGWLAIVVSTNSDASCIPSETYRILATKLGADGAPDPASGGFKTIGTGTTLEYLPDPKDATWCVYVQPAIDVADGRLAFADAPMAGAESSTMHIVTLDGSAPAVTIGAKQNVVSVALSEQSVAWIESSDPDAAKMGYLASLNGYPKRQFDWRVAEASLSDSTPEPVDIGESAGPAHPYAPEIFLDGSAVVATRYLPLNGPNETLRSSVVRVDASGLTVIADVSSSEGCVAGGAAAGVVALQCWFPDIEIPAGGTVGSGQPELALPAVWTPADGLRAVASSSSAPDQAWAAWVEPGWLFVIGGNNVSSETIYTAYPLAQLATP
jgi:hypothetical protein